MHCFQQVPQKINHAIDQSLKALKGKLKNVHLRYFCKEDAPVHEGTGEHRARTGQQADIKTGSSSFLLTF